MAGKGSYPRKVDVEKYSRNYERIFVQRCKLCGTALVDGNCKQCDKVFKAPVKQTELK